MALLLKFSLWYQTELMEKIVIKIGFVQARNKPLFLFKVSAKRHLIWFLRTEYSYKDIKCLTVFVNDKKINCESLYRYM